MTEREVIVQHEGTIIDTSRLDRYVHQLLEARQSAIASAKLAPLAPVVTRRSGTGLGLICFGVGFAALALSVLGAGLLISDRMTPLQGQSPVGRTFDASVDNMVAFHRKVAGGLEVVTLWRYPADRRVATAPSGQSCFANVGGNPSLLIAENGKPLDAAATMASRVNLTPEDLVAAMPLCTWRDSPPTDRPNHGPAVEAPQTRRSVSE